METPKTNAQTRLCVPFGFQTVPEFGIVPDVQYPAPIIMKSDCGLSKPFLLDPKGIYWRVPLFI